MKRPSFADFSGEELTRMHVQQRERILVRARMAAKKSPRSARSAAVLELRTLDSIAEVQGVKKPQSITQQQADQFAKQLQAVVEKYVTDPGKRKELERELRAKWQVLHGDHDDDDDDVNVSSAHG